MYNFTFLSPTRIIAGHGVENETGKWIKEYGGTKVLVHHDSAYVKTSGLVDKIIDNIKAEGIEVVELGGVVPNPRFELVLEGVELCRKEKVDFILAIGGGSTIDSAKGIAMGVPYDGDMWDFFTEGPDGNPLDVPKKTVPLGVVSTMAATGSECSNSCVLTRGDKKRFCDNDVNRPVFAIENPDLTLTLPKFQTFCGIVDIMSHSMERYFTDEVGNNEFTDRLCEAVFHTCMDTARVLMDDPNDYGARSAIMVCSSISHNWITGMGRPGDWSCHFIEHELSGEYNVTHGAGLAIITPAWMRYCYKSQMEKFTKWATRVMGCSYDFEKPERTVLEAIDRLENFFNYMGLPTHMKDCPEITGEVTEDIMYKMAKRVRISNADGTIGGIRHLTTEDIVNIFKLAN